MQSATPSGSAAIRFLLPNTGVIFRVWANADPEHLRKAIRKACSQRRTLVTLRPSVFLVNCMANISALAGRDNGEWIGDDLPNWEKHASPCNWRYTIEMRGKVPYITYHSFEKDPTERRLFEFLGTEHKREWKLTPARKKNRGGRPSNLRKKHPELFTNLPAKARAAGSSKALGLKKKKLLQVDFSDVMTPMDGLSKRDRRELDPDYERELAQLYDLEGGKQP